MGSYTKVIVSIKLTKDATLHAPLLAAMAEHNTELTAKLVRDAGLDHPFFFCNFGGADFLGNWDGDDSARAYFDPASNTLESISVLKNYGKEVPLFVDWVKSYLDEDHLQFIGHFTCDSDMRDDDGRVPCYISMPRIETRWVYDIEPGDTVASYIQTVLSAPMQRASHDNW